MPDFVVVSPLKTGGVRLPEGASLELAEKAAKPLLEAGLIRPAEPAKPAKKPA